MAYKRFSTMFVTSTLITLSASIVSNVCAGAIAT
jgi:hypothetical protein